MGSPDRNIQPFSRNLNLSKWNTLFDKHMKEWLSFKPKLNKLTYACYACRHLFSSKNSFIDHINRRGLLLTYKCNSCPHLGTVTFYNPCSFLLHTREHYGLLCGQINLDALEICLLPYGLGGFLPDPNIPLLYNVEDDNIGETRFVNTRFYSPSSQCMGQSIINLVPNELLFIYPQDPSISSMTLMLKQISLNIPRCKFVKLEDCNQYISIQNGLQINEKEVTTTETNNNFIVNTIAIKQEPEDLYNSHNVQYHMPVITKIESIDENIEIIRNNLESSVSNISGLPKCPECKQIQTVSMAEHFLKTDEPFQESLKCSICKYIAPTKCSLKAHERLHDNCAPYICPECGKDFYNNLQLQTHLEEVCFHLTKQVRIRCPGKKCGKIFAQLVTFSAHFLSHMQRYYACASCSTVFSNINEFLEHNEVHKEKRQFNNLYKCCVCTDRNIMYSTENYSDHVREHAKDRKQCLYVYICKRCHSYFRSTTTYATHLLRCSSKLGINPQIAVKQIEVRTKKKTELQQNETSNKTSSNILFTYSRNDKTNISFQLSQVRCILCNYKLPLTEMNSHRKTCKYQNPVVVLDATVVEEYLTDEIKKGKKKKLLIKSNKTSFNGIEEAELILEINDLASSSDIFQCKICSYNNKNRKQFQEHIREHRDLSTAYQCMECGECFVVKPTLVKHLHFFHHIKNIEAYLDDNDCYNKDAVRELETLIKSAPGESKEPVHENQCKVCLMKFTSSIELTKHFRTHGMAFLLKNVN